MIPSRSLVVALSLLTVAICGKIVIVATANSHDEYASTIGSEPSPQLSPVSIRGINGNNERVHTDPYRRALSVALAHGGCRLTFPQKPPPGTPITYAASYPGSGARMSWYLVEALTGLQTGSPQNGRGGEVVSVKTHYPLGKLPDFDDVVQRAFVVIRNPVHSIPSFFNHVYEVRNHLQVHTVRAPAEDWIKWRNNHLDTAIAEFKKFIMYWADRFGSQNCHILPYEEITDDVVGIEATRGLNDFLAQVEGVTPFATESIPCIWKAVVKSIPPDQQAEQFVELQLKDVLNQNGNAGAQEQDLNVNGEEQAEPSVRRRLFQHHDTQRGGAKVARLFTLEQLIKMSDMLLELAQKYERDNVRLSQVMMRYHDSIKQLEFDTI